MTKYKIGDKKNILVIGGAGFIGSFLGEELVKKNNVICLDNFITSNVENIRLLIQFPNFEFIKHDICQPINLEELPELVKFKINIHGIQEIYNLACPTVQKDYKKLAIETILANSLGVKNSLDLAIKYQAKYLLASTSSIYGECEEQVINENIICPFNHLAARSAYNEGKRFAEMMVVKYSENFNLLGKIARIFSTYGPRMISKDARLIPDFIKQALTNQIIEIDGDEQTLINYLYVQDLVEGLIKLMNYQDNLIVNFAGEQEFSLKEIVDKIIELTNSHSEIKFIKPPEFLTRPTKVDLTTAKEKLGWFPLISLADGLKQTIAYLKASKFLDIKTIQ